jgi:hypothetical protein
MTTQMASKRTAEGSGIFIVAAFADIQNYGGINWDLHPAKDSSKFVNSHSFTY